MWDVEYQDTDYHNCQRPVFSVTNLLLSMLTSGSSTFRPGSEFLRSRGVVPAEGGLEGSGWSLEEEASTQTTDTEWSVNWPQDCGHLTSSVR